MLFLYIHSDHILGLNMSDVFTITTEGYALEDKIAKKVSEKATHVYLPASWEGKKVRIILLENLDENE